MKNIKELKQLIRWVKDTVLIERSASKLRNGTEADKVCIIYNKDYEFEAELLKEVFEGAQREVVAKSAKNFQISQDYHYMIILGKLEDSQYPKLKPKYLVLMSREEQVFYDDGSKPESNVFCKFDTSEFEWATFLYPTEVIPNLTVQESIMVLAILLNLPKNRCQYIADKLQDAARVVSYDLYELYEIMTDATCTVKADLKS